MFSRNQQGISWAPRGRLYILLAFYIICRSPSRSLSVWGKHFLTVRMCVHLAGAHTSLHMLLWSQSFKKFSQRDLHPPSTLQLSVQAPTPNNDVLQYMHTTRGRCPSPSLVLLWHLWLIRCHFYLSCPLFGLAITILNMRMFMMRMIFWNVISWNQK